MKTVSGALEQKPMDSIVLLNDEHIIKQAACIRFYIGGEIFDSGELTLTNFRLLWISVSDLREMSLKDITKIDSTAGFFNVSSPKIILELVKIQQKPLISLKDWECKICNTINDGKNDKCSECGVKTSRDNFKNDGISCSQCTFINHDGNVCEMCGNPLYEGTVQIKLSFRQGGMSEFLADLLKYWNEKEWENIKLGPAKGVGGVSTVLDRLNESKIKVKLFSKL